MDSVKYGYEGRTRGWRSLAVVAAFTAIAACTNQEPKPAQSTGPAGSDEVTFELTGTRWALVRLGDQEVKVSEGGREAYIALNSADQSVVGYAGCNRISSTHRSDGSQLHFGEVTATRMFCEDMPTETALLDAMKSTASWRISGSQLELLDAQQQSLAIFEARNL
jgi:heat shock protein HslJ